MKKFFLKVTFIFSDALSTPYFLTSRRPHLQSHLIRVLLRAWQIHGLPLPPTSCHSLSLFRWFWFFSQHYSSSDIISQFISLLLSLPWHVNSLRAHKFPNSQLSCQHFYQCVAHARWSTGIYSCISEKKKPQFFPGNVYTQVTDSKEVFVWHTAKVVWFSTRNNQRHGLLLMNIMLNYRNNF